MYPFTAGDTKYFIQTSWFDVTVEKFMAMINGDIESTPEMISILTGIELENVDLFDLTIQLSPYMQWLKQPIDLHNLPLTEFIQVAGKFVHAKIVIGEETFGQKVRFEGRMKNNNNLVDVIPFILSNYLQPKWMQQEFDINKSITLEPIFKTCSIVEAYPFAKNLYDQLVAIKKNESESIKSYYSEEEIDAGIQSFERFGIMNTVDMLAQGNILNYEAVFKLDYNTVFTKMKMENQKRLFHKTYSDNIRDKNKQK